MTKKKLVVMDENVNLAMGQLGAGSSQFDAAMLLVNLVESYTEKDGSRLKENDSDRISDPYSQINAFGCVETGVCDPEGHG